MPTQITITVPYEDGLSFHLDSSSRHHEAPNGDVDLATDKALLGENLAVLSQWRVGEVERVITSAAALYAMRAGTISQCLDTAMVWERG
jgi:hypothetical protein